MRTTGTPAGTPAGATSKSPRFRPVAVGTSAIVAAGLVLGAVSTAKAESHSPASQPLAARTVALKTAGNPIHKVAGNLLDTPYFEQRVWPWTGTSLSRVERPLAPSGRLVLRVGAKSGKASVDNWPGEVRNSVAGAKYTATVHTRAAGWQSANRVVTLVVREHTASGTWVGAASQSLMMNYEFRTLTVSYTAKHNGNVVDVYAYQADHVWSQSAFYVDDVSLVSDKPQPTQPTPPTPPMPPTGNSPSTLGLLAYGSGQPTKLGDTSKYAYVVVQENQYSSIASIKRANPNTAVLAYMNTSTDSRTNCSSYASSAHYPGASFGVNYCFANKNHPDWFLKDRSGNRLHFSDYPFAMQMDMGNASFAEAWAAGVYAQAKHDGFDGIWIDDVNIDPGHGLNGRFAKYSDEQFGKATAAWGSRVGDYLRSRGMKVIANVGMQPWIQYRLDDTLSMAKHLTAVNREHFVRYGDICGPFGERFNSTANNGTPPLSSFLNYTNKLQAQGTKFTGVDYGYSNSSSDDLKAMTYGRALFLLSWNGTAGSAYFFRKCGVNDTALPQWTANLGQPLGGIQTLSNGVMTRKFQGGMVVLNPNRGGSSAKVSVPTGLHTMSGANADGGVYVAPQTAAILSS